MLFWKCHWTPPWTFSRSSPTNTGTLHRTHIQRGPSLAVVRRLLYHCLHDFYFPAQVFARAEFNAAAIARDGGDAVVRCPLKLAECEAGGCGERFVYLLRGIRGVGFLHRH